MNRRSTLKNLATTAGALLALPGWARSWKVTSLKRYTSSFTKMEQDLLAAVVDTIIPAGSSIGAKSVGVDLFLQKLFDRCYEKGVQDNIKKQLASLEASAQATHTTSFVACTQEQREALFTTFFASTIKEEKDFFSLLKSETIRGFNTSEVVMTKYLKYQVAPGHFYGCVEVTA